MVENNPFSNRAMIKNPDEFFGRKNELTTIFSRLSNLQSCNVFGERKIGKSSLLYYIFMKLRDGDEYRIAYIDLQDAKYHTVEGFLKYSLKELGSDPGVISLNNLNENLIAFSDSIEDLRKEIKPVLLIDEFENLTKRPEKFNNDFFDAMRSLGSNGNIAYVTASLHALKWLCIAGHFTSPFYNIFSQVPLGLFSPDETTEFLSAKREGVEFTKREIEFVKRIANNHPLHLQIACSHVVENRGKEYDEKKLRKDIKEEIKSFGDKWIRKERCIVKYIKYSINDIREIIKSGLGKK
jgi:AAA+ ATPase superfamily predicted ATPase